MTQRRVAVVGSGVAGLSAAYVLQRSGVEVTLFEADNRPGGHAHTHEVAEPDGRLVPVDSGFIVHNNATYPLLTRLFRELGVTTRDTEMSLSVTCAGCGLVYAGARGLRGLLPNPQIITRPGYLRMLAEIPRFHRAARALLAAEDTSAGPTLGAFVRDRGHSDYFVAHFLLPLVSAVWSCPTGTALDYPARYLFSFLANHGMLSVFGSPQWRTVEGGSREYVERVVKELTSVRLGTHVHAVERPGDGGVLLRTERGQDAFDGAVIATHADQALRMRPDATDAERSVLGAFDYSRNRTVLHTDATRLPAQSHLRASWNHRLSSCAPDSAHTQVSYHMNRLQSLDAQRDYVVSLNAGDTVNPDSVIAEMTYEHPVYTPESVAAQRLLPDLNDGVLAYAGAHHGWGFHEDGCRSGVEAAAALGAQW
ncbi:NAD(P)/FAD-dependent oxidoreductase [Nocardiopsis ansamitocini]|uniref:Amine oxidase n=1 Tax=Nocardiopsis ansamitocini TaxID=1670832 RepID=A0A9W6P7N2_9ACTN|nr:FAD-dependent oxidoreductase [Nocardiopsis ansamitocini]GLU48503.1 amine oxidase [Nocardiopsis ansamitocini]